MKKISFEELKKEIQKFQGKQLYVDISTLINTFIIVKKCRIIINNYRIVLSDSQDVDIEIGIEPILEIESEEDGSIFNLKFGMGEMVTLDFDKNS